MASRYHFGTSRPSLGETIGGALGTGLGQGLTALAETKLNSMLSRQKQAADKQKLVSLGIPDYEAQFLSHQNPEIQWQAARAWLVAKGAPDAMLPKQLGEPFNITPEQEAAAQQQFGMQQQQPQMAAQQPKTAADLLTQQGPISPFMRQALEGLQLPQQQPPQGAAMQALAPQAPQAMQLEVPQAQPQQMMQGAQRQGPKGIGEAFAIEQQMKKGVDKETAELKKELLRAQIEKTKKSAEGKTGGAKLSPDAEDFVVKTESKARTARPLLLDLNEAEEYIDKHEKEIQTSVFAAHAPTSFLNEPTRKMKQKMSKILTEMIQSDAQGRGSDLMRRIISEGKLELQQGPAVWREVINELRDEQEDNLRLDEIKNSIRRTLGSTPDDIGELARSQLSQSKTEFNALPDSEKISYLFNNPDIMKWITEITDENGKVIARRTKDGWRKVAK